MNGINVVNGYKHKYMGNVTLGMMF